MSPKYVMYILPLIIIWVYDNIQNKKMKMLIRNVQYGFRENENKLPENVQMFGTIENAEPGLEYNNINNVIDAHVALKELIPEFQKNNDAFYKYSEKLGDLHIYADGKSMDFIEATETTKAATSKKTLASIDSVDSTESA